MHHTKKVISVRMLGGFDISCDGKSIDGLPRRSVSVLSYLILCRKRTQTRDLLAGKFWSDQPEDIARKRLSNTLWKIRSLAREYIGCDLLSSGKNTVRLDPTVVFDIDSENFEEAFGAFNWGQNTTVDLEIVRSLETLQSLYGGDLLSGYYDDWIIFERERLQAKYHLVLQRLLSLHKNLSQYEVALGYAQRLVAADSLNESAHRETIRLYGLLGRSSDASRQFALCAEVLKSELGSSPSLETVRVLDHIEQDANFFVANREAKTDTFVGRTAEKAQLSEAVDRLMSGTGSVAIIEGRKGVGKSALMKQLADVARWRGASVLLGSHSPVERLQPFSGLCEAIEPVSKGLRGEHLVELVDPVWLRQVATLLPALSAIDGAEQTLLEEKLEPQEEVWRLSEAFTQIISAQGRSTPTVLILEDLQFSDADSLKVFEHMVKRVVSSRVLLCFTYCREDIQPSDVIWRTLIEAEKSEGSVRIGLEAFTLEETTKFVDRKFSSERVGVIEPKLLFEQTGGLPLLVSEVCRQAPSFEGRVNIFSDSREENPFDKLLKEQLAVLQEKTRLVIQILAVANQTLPADEIAFLADLPKKETLDHLFLAVSNGFILEDEGGCRIAASQMQSSIYRLTDTATCKAIHRNFLYLYASQEVVSAELAAYHATEAGETEEAYRWHMEAAHSAVSVNAYETAIRHLSLADEEAEKTGLSPIDRIDDFFLLEELVEGVGRRTEQKKVLDCLLDLPLNTNQKLRAQSRFAWYLALSDRFEEAAAFAAQFAEENVEGGNPYRGDFFFTAGSALLWAGNPEKAVEAFSDSVRAKEALQDSTLLARTMLGKSLIEQQRFQEGHDQLSEVLGEAESTGEIRTQIEALGHLSVVELLQGNTSYAEVLLKKALDLSKQIAYRRGEGVVLVNFASLCVLLGRGSRALALFHDAEVVFESLNSGRGAAFVKVNTAELNHTLLGKDDVAKSQATDAAIYFRSVGDAVHEGVALTVLCSIDRRQGRRRFARKRLHAVLENVSGSGGKIVQATCYQLFSVLEFDEGNFARAYQFAEKGLSIAEGISFDSLLPLLLSSQARACVQLGDVVASRKLADRAMSLLKKGSQGAILVPFYCASVFEELGDISMAKSCAAHAYLLLCTCLEGLGADSWRVVPENKAVVRLYDSFFVRKDIQYLPRKGIPLGRKLQDEDFILVEWHVSDPSDYVVASSQEMRQRKIERLCLQASSQGGAVRVNDLAAALGVSSRTIKRDLHDLRSRNIQVRTRGFL